MKKVLISDDTLLKAFATDMSFKDKLNFAMRLDKINVDYIELGPLTDKTEGVLAKTVSTVLQNSALTIIAEDEKQIDYAVNALENAKKKRIQISLPASIVQIEYNLHIKPQIMIDKAVALVKYAKEKIDNIEVSICDATRSEPQILYKLIEAVLLAGATAICISDNAGNMFPVEFEKFILGLLNDVKGLKNAELYVKASNRFKMSLALSLVGINAGANGVKTNNNTNLSTDITPLFETIREIGDKNGLALNVSSTDLIKILSENNKKTVSKRADNTEVKIESLESMKKLLLKSGYDLNEDDVKKVFNTYINLRGKKTVGSKELDVIVATVATQVPEEYQLISFVINSGNIITSTANVNVERNMQAYSGLSSGDGPIDAAFNAIENIIGHHYELDDFSVNSITEGREAIGEAVVKLRSEGKIYSGVGISTDIIGASIRAYLSALNKIVYEEKNKQ